MALGPFDLFHTNVVGKDDLACVAALAEMQRVGAQALHDAVTRARDRGVSWQDLAQHLDMPLDVMCRRFGEGRPLPALPAGELFGRESELADLGRLVERGQRLVTVTGAGGIGKTRFVLEFLHRTAWSGGLWWVDLSTTTNVEEAVEDLTDGLLVLDTCEHVADEVAAFVSRLLTERPDVRVIATSRAELRLSGERVIALGPLPPTEAVRLFLDHAGDVDGRAAAELCARLDHLPLAIELAGRQAVVLDPPAMLAALDDRFTVLAGGPADVPARQRSLAASIRWSYDLLDHVEQAVFRRIALFSGSFDHAAASAACAELGLSGGQLVPLLRALVAKSLVESDGGCLRLLDSVRIFGRQRLAEHGETEAVLDRLAAWLRSLAAVPLPQGLTVEERAKRRLRHRHDLECLVSLRIPGDRGADLVSALTMSREVAQEYLGLPALLLEWLPRYETGSYGRALLLVHLCRVYSVAGDPVAVEHGEEAVEAARATGVPWLELWAVRGLAYACVRVGAHERAEELLGPLVELARTADDRTMAAQVLATAAWHLLMTGRTDEADAIVAELMSEEPEAHLSHIFSDLAHTAGLIALVRGDTAFAAAHFAMALPAARLACVLSAVEGFALTDQRTGRPGRAVRLFAAASAVREQLTLRREPWYEQLCQDGADEARAAMAPRDVATAEREGAAWTLDQAVAFALEEEPAPLSQAEYGVATLVAKGLTNTEIAARQRVTPRAVATHLERIRRKLDLPCRSDVVRWVIDQERRSA